MEARAACRAVPALTTYTLESTRAICDAAQRTELPVILAARTSSFRGVGRELLAAVALAAARAASVPVGVHLDHSTDPDEIRACIVLGYSSVMIDGSHLPFEDNVALTPAIGTVHGFTSRPVDVDLHRLRAIAEVAGVPLVLHGASGLSDADLTAAVASGVAKVNINAELRRGYFAALDAGRADGGDDIPRLQARAITAMTEITVQKLLLLGGANANKEREAGR